MNAAKSAPHVLLGKIIVIVSIAVHLTMTQSFAKAKGSCPRKCKCYPGRLIDCIGNSHTKIHEEIPDNTEGLLLYDNKFDSAVLRRANFSRFTDLINLRVDSCGIESIDADTFMDLKNLTYLYLPNNRIKIIQGNTFGGLHLRILDLSINRGIKLTPDSFSGLSVYELSLHICSLKEVNPEVFLPLKSSLRELVLLDNELTGLSEGFKTVFNSLEILHIGWNPFNCDCNLAWFKEFVDSHEAMISKYSPPSCQSPAALEYKKIRDLQLSDFRCQHLSWMI